LDALAVCLADKEECVRERACQALGSLGEKAVATPKVLDALMVCLADKEECVRESACQALGSLGDNVASSDLPQILTKQNFDDQFYAIMFCWINSVHQCFGTLQLTHQQDYALVAFVQKSVYRFPLQPRQAQILLHLVLRVNAMLKETITPINLKSLYQLHQELPALEQDTLLLDYQKSPSIAQTILTSLLPQESIARTQSNSKNSTSATNGIGFFGQTNLQESENEMPVTSITNPIHNNNNSYDSDNNNSSFSGQTVSRHFTLSQQMIQLNSPIHSSSQVPFNQACGNLLAKLQSWSVQPALKIMKDNILVLTLEAERVTVEEGSSWLKHVSKLIAKTWPGRVEGEGSIESDDDFHTLQITAKTPQHAGRLKQDLENSSLFHNNANAQMSLQSFS
jgi:hypothetical protein